ncbi:MAG TPA: GNAT family N-acetyltransferase [Gaiellaceae bacterium]|jgi:RimJ/RimL family protein N-acetyltransferase
MSLETERLRLRLPTLDDANVIGELVGDAEVVRFLGGQIASPDEHEGIVERWLQRWEEQEMGPFIVERREDGRFVGRTGILVWDARDWTHTGTPDPEFAQPEVGWAFARAAWGNGYATEAARAVLEWTCERGVRGLVSVIAPANVRSQRVAERLGATPTETVQLHDTGDAVVWRYPD